MHQQPPCMTASFSKAGQVESDNSLTSKCLFGLNYALSTLFDDLAEQVNCWNVCRPRAEITHFACVNNPHMDRDRQLVGLTTQPSERHKHIRARGYIGSSALGYRTGFSQTLYF